MCGRKVLCSLTHKIQNKILNKKGRRAASILRLLVESATIPLSTVEFLQQFKNVVYTMYPVLFSKETRRHSIYFLHEYPRS